MPLPALGALAARAAATMAPKVANATKASTNTLTNVVSKSDNFQPQAALASQVRGRFGNLPKTNQILEAATGGRSEILQQVAGKFVGGGQESAAKPSGGGALSDHAGGLMGHAGGAAHGGLMSHVAGAVAGGGGLLQHAATEVVEHSPAGMLLRHTKLGQEAAKVVAPVAHALDNPLVRTAVGLLGPEGKIASEGLGVFSGVVDSAVAKGQADGVD